MNPLLNPLEQQLLGDVFFGRKLVPHPIQISGFIVLIDETDAVSGAWVNGISQEHQCHCQQEQAEWLHILCFASGSVLQGQVAWPRKEIAQSGEYFRVQVRKLT